MKEIMNLFNEYAKKYDLKNKKIMWKFHHSYRVMEFAHDIAFSLKLDEEDIELATIAGLFHDIARFKQLTEYDTYNDAISFDHGDMGYTILKEELINKIISDKTKQNIILVSTKNHNKFELEDNLTEKELLISKIVRDADKLDIMKECDNSLTQNCELDEKIIEQLKNHQLVLNELSNSEIGSLFRSISFIFDLNFNYSYKYILDNNIIQNKINLAEIYTNSELKELEENLINYMKEKITC